MFKEVKKSIDIFEETQRNQVQATPYQRYAILFYTSHPICIRICEYVRTYISFAKPLV